MNVMHRNFPIIIIWGLVVFNLIFSISGMEYVILAFCIANVVVNVLNNGVDVVTFKTLLALFILILIMCFGYFLNPTMQAVRCVVAIVCVWMFSYGLLTFAEMEHKQYYNYVFLGYLFLFVLRYLAGGASFLYLQNTLAAGICFLFYDYAILDFFASDKQKIDKKQLLIYGGCFVLSAGLIYVTGSRTALLTFLIIPCVYVGLALLRLDEKSLRFLFWVIVVIVFLVIYAYINIRQFSWYDDINEYSRQLFGKNLDSARPHLWSTELKRLEGNWLFGVGTGVLPQLERYANASFHNTYIQLLIQNGVMGLSVFLIYLYCIWAEIAKYCHTMKGKLLLSYYTGMLLLNCFEVTLLSNKIFIGMVQWFGLMMGLHCLRKSEE